MRHDKHHFGQVFDRLRAATLALAFVCILTMPLMALGAELCVRCSEPDVTYTCRTDLGGSKLESAGAKLLCLSQLAQRFGHAKCAIRPTGGLHCLGQVVDVKAEDAISAPPASSATAPEALPVEPSGRVAATRPAAGPRPKDPANPRPYRPDMAEPSETRPPETMEELAKRAAENSKENLDQAGKVAKEAWDCLSSLLTKC